jgi:small-conductance mechanosensitive channel
VYFITYERIKTRFDEIGMPIPFPQRDIPIFIAPAQVSNPSRPA